MATIEFELNDSNGISTNIGDEIEVVFPEVEIRTIYDEIDYYRPQTKTRAKVLLPPSKGLQLRILEIIEVTPFDEGIKDEGFYDNYKVGQVVSFRRTVWHWRNLKTLF